MSLSAHFFVFNLIILELTIFNENGVIEIVGNIILVLCLLRCLQYSLKSHIRQGHYFWIAAILVFFIVIRRELNYLADVFIPSGFSIWSHSYDWWEDSVLLLIYIITAGLLIYSWRYFWVLLKDTAIALYIIVAALALLQYMGENAIGFSPEIGVAVEELSENIIYTIALLYLLSFDLSDFEGRLSNRQGFELEAHNS